MRPPNKILHAESSPDDNAPTSASSTDVGAVPMTIDEDQSILLVQWQSQQYENVLPQPPPSIPSGHTDLAPELKCNPLRDFIDTSSSFFLSTPPSHNPEEAVTLQYISSVPVIASAEPNAYVESDDMLFYPYPNQSSFELGHWYWHSSMQKSHQGFRDLINIVSNPDFDPEDVRSTSWDKINLKLGVTIQDNEEDKWEDKVAGWQKTQVTIEDDKLFHYEPYKLQWSAPHLLHEVKIQDATHLTMFGNAKLWPVYMYLANESKYCHSNHVAYFQKTSRAPTLKARELAVNVQCTANVNYFKHSGRFYPQFFTYSVDYPEKGLIVTICQLGGCPVEAILKSDSQ
ncbi:hypothetical protein BDR03DRAFT_987137 [Suillus americanus]|nr:hypothetical protein BDR03DRAFT_987137 [Suillus americanus]